VATGKRYRGQSLNRIVQEPQELNDGSERTIDRDFLCILGHTVSLQHIYGLLSTQVTFS
jgi:hypothetical protein